MEPKKYNRIVLKLSGEALAGKQGYGIDPETVETIAKQIVEVNKLNIQVAIVVGGGNIWRGLSGSAKGMDRVSADYMGMLATVMNSLALQDAMEKNGVATRVQTAINMQQVAEPYIRRRAIRHMEKGRVVILVAGDVLAEVKGQANSLGVERRALGFAVALVVPVQLVFLVPDGTGNHDLEAFLLAQGQEGPAVGRHVGTQIINVSAVVQKITAFCMGP